MPKTPAITALADSLASLLNPESLGIDASIEAKVCNLCNASVDPDHPECVAFEGDADIREYLISATCQTCQDATFGV